MTMTDTDLTEDYRRRLASVVPRNLPPEVDIFDEQNARKGARLNRAGYSLRQELQRRLFGADFDGWAEQFHLTDEERNLIRQQDWIALWQHGMSIYVMVKLAAVLNTSLAAIGKQMKEAQ